MASPQTADELQPILKELEKQTDRGMAIIAAALIDELLTELLEKKLILSKTLAERMFSFDKNGALASFSSKIDLAYAIGAIRAEHKDDLHLIRRVRNKFAHQLQPIDFQNSEVKSYCQSLSVCKNLDGWRELETRIQFSAAFTALLTMLMLVKSNCSELCLDECHTMVDRVIKVCIEGMTSEQPITTKMIVDAQRGSRD